MEEKLFQVLKKETLFSCYEALAKHEFDERDLPKLSKLLEPIFIRTEAYVCTVTSDNIDTAVNMKENVDKFLEKLKKFDSNFLIREMIEELEKLWNVIKRLSDIRQKSNEKEYGKVNFCR
uniref:Uncharacterized protein n=1 Tax=Panagrolaimus davidi TaxID=227884 RepID=A0A914PRT4_9BILA